MPTQSTTYNSRVTDESLEKRFRDTFRSQGGAELVDDLYAQGVIVPVVDFTAAATGQELSENLQTAWDFSTGSNNVTNATTTLISNAGFWQVDLTYASFPAPGASPVNDVVQIFDGTTAKNVWGFTGRAGTAINELDIAFESKFVVFLRSGDILRATIADYSSLDVWYRQIATVSGDLINPSGFTSS